MNNSEMKEGLSLLLKSPESEMIAFYNGRVINKKIFLSHVEKMKQSLNKQKYNINLCQNRYHFLVVFTACILLKKITLLPSSQVEKEIERLKLLYKGSMVIDDNYLEAICAGVQSNAAKDSLTVERDQIVAIVFTSGTTGIPKENRKTWQQMCNSAARVKERFFKDNIPYSIIATVPPQHMFGFEMSVVYPLIFGFAIHADRPFYPLDIKKAISDMPLRHVLITTPLHLKVCNGEGDKWPEIDFIISATAEMEKKTAEDAERILKTKVFEVYGCSEAGAIATRQMTENSDWYLLRDYKLSLKNEETLLNLPESKEFLVIPDYLEIYNDNYFKLVGRNSDIINIGGKRGSLKDLKNNILVIEGVSDAIFILPDERFGRRARTAALVVSDLAVDYIRQELIKYIDSIFMPRPLIVVKKLPYNELGKLRRNDLIALIKKEVSKRDKLNVFI